MGGSALNDVETGSYTIDPAESVIRFTTRAMFGLVAVRGTFKVGHGTVSVASPIGDSTLEAVVLAASVDTGNKKRDDHVRSADYLHADVYPEFRFRGERFELAGAEGTVHGQLTVHEVAQPVTLHVDAVSANGGRVTARATTTIDRYAFGLTTAKGMTGRKLELTLEIVATR